MMIAALAMATSATQSEDLRWSAIVSATEQSTRAVTLFQSWF